VPKDYRIHSLDSLRGLAAVSVVFLHILSIYGAKDSWAISATHGNFLAFLLVRTPVGIFFAGGAAVILFFILSGFVLSLPFLSDHPQSYHTFVIRRICRIYLPYAAALFIAIGVRGAVSVEPVHGTTPWFTAFWSAPPTLGTVAGYLAMTGFPYHTNIDFVVWSLIHEMRISLIFPLLLTATSRSRLWLRLLAFFGLSFACGWWAVRIGQGASVTQLSIQTMLQTGSYIWFFVVGIELARHRRMIAAWVVSRRRISFGALLFLAACLYCTRSLFPTLGPTPESDFIIGIGAAGFIALALGRARLDRWLTWAPFLFLGRISYSLYLFHPIVLLAFVYALHNVLSPTIILIAIVPASVLAAWVARRLIEEPSMQIGRFLTRSKPG
jgi:peptidoglycan/LPS O-acetylase OafA/YrhL